MVTFNDNQVLALVLGPHDRNLAILEDRLDLKAIAHGNVISLEGSAQVRAAAKEILEHLYGRAQDGQEISAGDVEGAIRHAGETPLGRKPKKQKKPKDNSEEKAEAGQGQIKTRRKHITARTKLQTTYIKAMEQKDLVFGIGPAGTGKTYLAVAFAAAMLEKEQVERIILSRPAVEAGERLGFLPGDLKEKVDPYLRPLYDALYETLSREKVEKCLENETIEVAPLAFMRGRTLSNAVVILDEAQNCTSMQMKMFLTRLGEGSKMIITGDPSQVDLPPGQSSGLMEAVNLLSDIDDIERIAFTGEDVVRRALVGKIVKAYDKLEGSR